MKKRVERSFQDPSTVITTYEGKHNHHLPATLRGNVSGMFPPAMMSNNPAAHMAGGPSIPQELIMPSMYNYGGASGSMYQQSTVSPYNQQQQLHFSRDYGLLQDMVKNPSMVFKHEP